jgi:hypothetical protein
MMTYGVTAEHEPPVYRKRSMVSRAWGNMWARRDGVAITAFDKAVVHSTQLRDTYNHVASRSSLRALSLTSVFIGS